MICLQWPVYSDSADSRKAQAHVTQYLPIFASSAFHPHWLGCSRMDDGDLHKFGCLRIDVAALRDFGYLRIDVAVLHEFGGLRMDVAALREFDSLPMDVAVLRQFGWLIDVDLQILGETGKKIFKLRL